MKTKLHSETLTLKGLLLIAIFVISGAMNLMGQTFDKNYQDGRLYFKFKDNVNVDIAVRSDNSVDFTQIPFVAALQNSYRLKSMERPFDLNQDNKLLRTFMLEIEDFDKINEVLSKLQLENELEYVEKVPMDYIHFVPNDTLYNLYTGPNNWNWHLDRIQAEQAWDVTKGSSSIKVAVVDNAVWVDHPDLANKIVLQRDTYYNTNNANPPAQGDPFDWSHGTHCAGLVAASSDNNIGVASIGYDVSIIAVKAANNANANGIYGYPGIQWAANNGANVISMSWGGPGYSATNQNLINTISNMGIVLLASAGNDNVSTPHYPSGYNNVISIASTNSDDQKTDFSNYGTAVDLCAPGGYSSPGPTGLLSTTYSQGTYGYYDLMYGTSMATPVAAGLAGLIKSLNPALSNAQVENIMKTTADDISAVNPDYIGQLGAGRINAYQAVLNTPFQPTASFSTPVTTIIPGEGINFTDHSVGVPSTWQWTFQGGTPATSNVQNPTNVKFNTPGVYDVTLTVTNSFGSNTLVLEDYINATNTPSPYLDFGVSNARPCIRETVALSDSSLYGPTGWEWVITPDNFEFVNGTSAASQNPEISFLVPGLYSVAFTASNANGSSSMTAENLINVAGALPTYEVDMEDGTAGYFMVWDTIKSQSKIAPRAANASNFGIHFHGDPVPTGWSGSPTSGTATQAWESNLAFHGMAHICGVDGSGMDNIALSLDLRQTYSLGPRFSWFRVLVNGEQVADEDGNTDFNPATAAADPWKRLTFDLSAYAGTIFDITLQSATRFADKNQGEGDNVFIDNISITNTTNNKPLPAVSQGLRVYPNPSDGLFTIALDKVEGAFSVKVVSLLGNTVYSFNGDSNGRLLKSMDLNNLPSGVYLLNLTTGTKQFNQRIVIR